MSAPQKRVVIFTAGRLNRELEILIQQLSDSHHVELVGVVVDQWRRPWRRMRFLMKRWGLGIFAFSCLCNLIDRCSLAILWKNWHDRWVPAAPSPSFDDLANQGFPVHFVANINGKQAAELVNSLQPELGVIVGGRILKDRITQIPKLGTLNIHKHDATKYRGSPQIGYPERKNNDDQLGVTIHFAISKVDEGDIVSMAKIPIETFDDQRSLAIKANVHGMQAYFDAIESVAQGDYTRQPQPVSGGKTYLTTPYSTRFRFWRPYHRQLNGVYRRPGEKKLLVLLQSFYRTVRFTASMLALPWLVRRRKMQEKQGNAPIVMLYYHGVGNGGENWMTLPMHRMHEDVTYLKEHYAIISLEEAVQRLRSGKNYETAAVLTFDDGYKSCFDNLVPYLNYYQVPGTIFCCPEASSSQTLHAHDADNGCTEARLMSADELAHASSEYVTIGSHGNFHEDMGRLAGADLQTAVVTSGQTLQRITGRPMPYFSFPFGKKHHMSTEAFERGSQQYDAMFSAFGGYNFPDPTNRFHFQRIANPQTLTSLIAIMSGLHRFRPFYVDRPEAYCDPVQQASTSARKAA